MSDNQCTPYSLPEYVIADDGAGRDFVIRLQSPRFILEISREDNPVWIDPQPEIGKEYIREAALFFLEQVARFSYHSNQ